MADDEAAESSVSAAAAMWEALAAAMLLADLLLAESFFVFFLPDFNGRDDWLGLDSDWAVSDWAVSGLAVAGRAVDCPVLRGVRRSTLPLCVRIVFWPRCGRPLPNFHSINSLIEQSTVLYYTVQYIVSVHYHNPKLKEAKY